MKKTKFRSILIEADKGELVEELMEGLGIDYIIDNFRGSEDFYIIYTRTDKDTFTLLKRKLVLTKEIDLYW